jgi:hypothetical protein
MNSKFSLGLLISTAAFSAGSGTPTNLVVNGDFEAPVVAEGRYVLFAPGQTFPGWKVVGAPGNVAPISGKYVSYGFRFPAQHGKQWIDLTGLSNSATGIEQVITTVPGARYDITLYVGNIVDPHKAYGTSSSVEVFAGGTSLGVVTNKDGAGTNVLTWKQFHLTFTATTASTAIQFINRDPKTDNSNGLDNVLVEEKGE